MTAANRISAPLRSAAAAGALPAALAAAPAAPPGEVAVASFATWPEEVDWIADQIWELGLARGATAGSWSDICVLTRRNADIGPIYAELTKRDIPTEIVGLGGLLSLPEVADVVATLRLVHDPTNNPDLIRLLTGPRWSVGPRDLALLGQQAAAIVGRQNSAKAQNLAAAQPSRAERLEQALADAVRDVDPADLVCLAEAMSDPGDAGFSPAALRAFAGLTRELGQLRYHRGDSVLDLTRRVITTIGLDVELWAASPSPVSNSRQRLGPHAHLSAFLEAVSSYTEVDAAASLGGLLAWLQAENDHGIGLEQAVPSDADSVKLLTVHRAKGLEWETVFLPALVQGTFPSDRVTDNWLTNAAVLPAPLRGDADSVPQLSAPTGPEMKDYHQDLGAEQQRAEDRLAYVAVTRAKTRLIATGHHWRADLSKPKDLSAYLLSLGIDAAAQGRVLAEAPPPGKENPLQSVAAAQPWPGAPDPEAFSRRQAAAEAVEQARGRAHSADLFWFEGLDLDHQQLVNSWDDEIGRLLAEADRNSDSRHRVPLPATIAATAVARLQADREGYAAELVRPMPQRPRSAAGLGSRFHQWVEQYYGAVGGFSASELIESEPDPDEIAGAELQTLCAQFAAGQFAQRQPVAVEAPFEQYVANRLIRGRIDAVFTDTAADTYLVVDWKTTRSQTANPLQLAIYRHAWAAIAGVPVAAVRAGYYWVRTDRLDVVADLPDLSEVAAMLTADATT